MHSDILPVMKRFYKQAMVGNTDTGFVVLLDGRIIKTPNKHILTVPTKALAMHICSEWNAVPVDGEVITSHMPMMCLASTAVDKVSPHMDDIRRSVMSYADADVICYRSDTYGHLRQKQQNVWDSWVVYAHDILHMPIVTTTGIIPTSQSVLVIQQAEKIVMNMNTYQLTAFADMVSVLGSFVLAMAVIKEDADTKTAFEVCYLDEIHQISEWGQDAESQQVLSGKQQTLTQAARFYKASF